MARDIAIEPRVEALVMPENIRVAELVARQRRLCETVGCDFDYYAFGLGQSPFPPPEALTRALERHSDKGHYSAAQGIEALRAAIAAFYFRHFDLRIDPARVVVGAGTKELLYTIFRSVSGDVIIPTPSWIGYAPQVKMLGKKFHPLPLDPDSGYRLQPAQLEHFLSCCEGEQHLLVLNNPHNQTGVLYSRDELEELVAVCRRHGTLVVADEIYALTTYAVERFTSLGKIYPEGAFVTGGLSKDRSAGGYRLGACILPSTVDGRLRDALVKVTATTNTNVSTPIQYAAVEAYLPNAGIEAYMATARHVDRIVGTYMSQAINEIDGLHVTVPEGGFYCFVDFNELAPELRGHGVATSNELGASLLGCPFHVSTVTGSALMLEEDNCGARFAFVDYDGGKAFERYKDRAPVSSEEDEFVREHAPRIVEGVQVLSNYIAQIRTRLPLKSLPR